MPSTLNFKIKYRVPTYIIYQALTDETIIFKYTQAKTSYPAKQEEDFSLYDGAITGKIKELTENKKIVQTWKFSNWNDCAELKLTLKERKGNECEVVVDLKNIPDRDNFNKTIETETIKAGFMVQIFENISKWLGYPQNKDETDSEDED
mmetsp:Transcript_1942/g.1993  ORF Transcript_1942/g.1993 Transcript_1942/m.1993 type:complete len:149 (-) Transcript_1942:252-698(-)